MNFPRVFKSKPHLFYINYTESSTKPIDVLLKGQYWHYVVLHGGRNWST